MTAYQDALYTPIKTHTLTSCGYYVISIAELDRKNACKCQGLVGSYE